MNISFQSEDPFCKGCGVRFRPVNDNVCCRHCRDKKEEEEEL